MVMTFKFVITVCSCLIQFFIQKFYHHSTEIIIRCWYCQSTLCYNNQSLTDNYSIANKLLTDFVNSSNFSMEKDACWLIYIYCYTFLILSAFFGCTRVSHGTQHVDLQIIHSFSYYKILLIAVEKFFAKIPTNI